MGTATFFRGILGHRVVAVAMGQPEHIFGDIDALDISKVKWQMFVIGPQDDVFVHSCSLSSFSYSR